MASAAGTPGILTWLTASFHVLWRLWYVDQNFTPWSLVSNFKSLKSLGNETKSPNPLLQPQSHQKKQFE